MATDAQEEETMVTVNQRSIQSEAHQREGLLTDRVEQDLAEALNEFGTQAVDHEAEPANEGSRIGFGYGIPMAGVRYYAFTGAE